MKNQGSIILIAVMMAFLLALIGFYLGRNTGRAPIQISKAPQSTQSSTVQGNKVNINTATTEELQNLPGIGQMLAQRIVEYRDANGPFQNVAELTKVNGIGLDRLENLLEYITV